MNRRSSCLFWSFLFVLAPKRMRLRSTAELMDQDHTLQSFERCEGAFLIPAAGHSRLGRVEPMELALASVVLDAGFRGVDRRTIGPDCRRCRWAYRFRPKRSHWPLAGSDAAGRRCASRLPVADGELSGN